MRKLSQKCRCKGKNAEEAAMRIYLGSIIKESWN